MFPIIIIYFLLSDFDQIYEETSSRGSLWGILGLISKFQTLATEAVIFETLNNVRTYDHDISG